MSRRKYSGIFPSLYACYDGYGRIFPEGIRRLCRHLVEKGANGIYVCGSAGECLLLTPDERMLTLECALDEVSGRVPVIAHVACPRTDDSRRLAAHAKSAGADAISALPPFFYKVSESEMMEYWCSVSAGAAGLDFFIYDIPSLSPNRLSESLLRRMARLEDLAGVKASVDSAMDVERFCDVLGEERSVFCGSDGLLMSALSLGACGGIGGTYAPIVTLYSELYRAHERGDGVTLAKCQRRVWSFLERAQSRRCSIYALMKELLRQGFGIDAGGVRSPLRNADEEDVRLAFEMVTLGERNV